MKFLNFNFNITINIDKIYGKKIAHTEKEKCSNDLYHNKPQNQQHGIQYKEPDNNGLIFGFLKFTIRAIVSSILVDDLSSMIVLLLLLVLSFLIDELSLLIIILLLLRCFN